MNRRQTELEGRKRRERGREREGERERRGKKAARSVYHCVRNYTEQTRSEDAAAVDKISAQ